MNNVVEGSGQRCQWSEDIKTPPMTMAFSVVVETSDKRFYTNSGSTARKNNFSNIINITDYTISVILGNVHFKNFIIAKIIFLEFNSYGVVTID